MKHLLKIEEVRHVDRDGKTIWIAHNLPNTFHNDGEEFMLKALFSGEEEIPDNYYFGLDKRTSITEADNLASLLDEPENDFNGYVRQAISSSSQFVIDTTASHFYARSPILHFSASGGSWGPVRNLFLSTTRQSDYGGYLIASVPLSQTITVNDGESISVRMGLSLKDC